MSRTFKDRRDDGNTLISQSRAYRTRDHFERLLTFSTMRWLKANAEGRCERSARNFAAVDRSTRELDRFRLFD